MAYIILCLRFALLVRLIASSHRKELSNLRQRTTRKTRYEWLARPYSTGTFTLLDVTNFLVARTPAATVEGSGSGSCFSGFCKTDDAPWNPLLAIVKRHYSVTLNNLAAKVRAFNMKPIETENSTAVVIILALLSASKLSDVSEYSLFALIFHKVAQ